MRHWEIAVEAIFPPSIETDTSISPCGQLPQARYIPSLYRRVGGVAGAVPALAPGLAPVVVAGAGDVACEPPAGVLRAEAGGLGLFFFSGAAAEGEAAAGAFVAEFDADDGITAAIVADAVYEVCESNRCAAGLVR